MLFLSLIAPLARPRWAALFIAATFCVSVPAQVTVKPDGKMRSLFGLSASNSSGNTETSTLTLNGEAVRQTDDSKWGLLGRGIYATTSGATTASNMALGTQYDRDLTNNTYFGFAKIDWLRDRPSNVASRASAYGGLGRHMVRTDENTWDIFGGLGYTDERFVAPANVNGDLRTRYPRAEAVLSQVSTHKLTRNTSLRQKLELYPSLEAKGEFRTILDVGLAVAMTERLQLTAGATHRYNSSPGVGVSGVALEKNDTLFVTGVALRFD